MIGVWLDPEVLGRLPTTGPAWEALKKAADVPLGPVRLDLQEDPTNVRTLAKALVFARTGEEKYRTDVFAALAQFTTQTGYSGRALALGRQLCAYVIAADLIDLATHDGRLDAAFRARLQYLRACNTAEGGTLIECHENRPNNWGAHAGASRVAVAAYLRDLTELERCWTVFRGWTGDWDRYHGFKYGDLSWQADPANPVGINPIGSRLRINGVWRSTDGVLPDDLRRDEPPSWPPSEEGLSYSWEALQGAVAQAVILERAGFPAWSWSDDAILRAFAWLHDVADNEAAGDDTWQPHVINAVYGLEGADRFPAPIPSRPGKNVGWTDWTHSLAPAVPPHPVPTPTPVPIPDPPGAPMPLNHTLGPATVHTDLEVQACVEPLMVPIRERLTKLETVPPIVVPPVVPPPVIPPPVIPPPPSGVLPFAHEDFERDQVSGLIGTSGMSWQGGVRTSISTALARTGTRSMRMLFQAAPSGVDSFAEQRFLIGRKVRKFGVRFSVYMLDGTEGLGARYFHRDDAGPDNNKIIRLWNEPYGGGETVGASVQPLGNGDSSLIFEYSRDGQSIGNYGLGPVPMITNATRGRWVDFAAYFAMATGPDANDGVGIIMWDGRPIFVHRKLDIYSTLDWDAGYLLGWANSGFLFDTPVFVDYVDFFLDDPRWTDVEQLVAVRPAA